MRSAEWRQPGEDVLTTSVYEFAASHRLHSPELSDEENRELFGKCDLPHGHGHNYVLEVTVGGPVDAKTGCVIAPAVLDGLVEREILSRYDHRNLNLDVEELRSVVPSSEMVTRAIWQRLAPAVPPPARLARVLLRETPRNFFEYSGESAG